MTWTRSAGSGQDLTQEQRERLARDLRLRWWLLGGAAVVVVGGLVGGVLLGHARRPERPVPWIPLVSIAVGMLALLGLSSVVGMKLRSRSTSLQRLVLSGDRTTIRRVSRQLRRREPVAEDDLEVARAIVASNRTQRWLPWLFATIIVANALPLVTGSGGARPQPTFLLVLRAASCVLMLVGAVLVEVSRRRVVRVRSSRASPPGRRLERGGRVGRADDHRVSQNHRHAAGTACRRGQWSLARRPWGRSST